MSKCDRSINLTKEEFPDLLFGGGIDVEDRRTATGKAGSLSHFVKVKCNREDGHLSAGQHWFESNGLRIVFSNNVDPTIRRATVDDWESGFVISSLVELPNKIRGYILAGAGLVIERNANFKSKAAAKRDAQRELIARGFYVKLEEIRDGQAPE